MALPTLSSNSPSPGFISWTAFGIQYEGTGFNVPAGNTDKRFVWWEYRNGVPSLVGGDDVPELSPDDILLFLNKGGIGAIAPVTDLMDGSLLVTGSVLADAIGANQINTTHLEADSVTADELSAGAVQAQHVSAGAITVDKLSSASVSENLLANGSFEEIVNGTIVGWEQTAATNGHIAAVTGVSSSGAYAVRLAANTLTANVRLRQAPAQFIPVTSVGGRRWYLGARVGAGTATSRGFYLRANWFDANKVLLTSGGTSDARSNVGIGTSWAMQEGTVIPPTGARYLGVEIMLVSPNVTTNIYVDEIVAHEIIVAAQIGDGQITTPKLVANAVTAEKADLGTFTADTGFITALQAKIITATTFQGKEFIGGTFTGALLQTDADPALGVKLGTAGIQAFDSRATVDDGSGVQITNPDYKTRTFHVDPSSGNVDITGTLQTSPSGRRVIIEDSNPSGNAGTGIASIQMFGGSGTSYAKMYHELLGPGVTRIEHFDNDFLRSTVAFQWDAVWIDILGENGMTNNSLVLSGSMLETYGSLVVAGNTTVMQKLIVEHGGDLDWTVDAWLSNHGFQIGDAAGFHMRMDANEIAAMNGSARTTLYIQSPVSLEGGELVVTSGDIITKNAKNIVSDGKMMFTGALTGYSQNFIQSNYALAFTQVNSTVLQSIYAANIYSNGNVHLLTDSGMARLVGNNSGGNNWISLLRDDQTGGLAGLRRWSGNNGTGFNAMPVYDLTTGSAANVNISSGGWLQRSTSARKYKQDIQAVDPAVYEDNLLSLAPRSWIDKGEAAAVAEYDRRIAAGEPVLDPDTGEPLTAAPYELQRYYGYVAEEVLAAGKLGWAVTRHDVTGEVEGLDYARLAAAVIPIVSKYRDRLRNLETQANQRVTALEGKVTTLEGQVSTLQKQGQNLAARITALENA